MTFSGTVEGMTDDRKLEVSRTIDAPADQVFDLLTLPERHKEFDGSGMVVSDDRSQRIQAVGDVFTMNVSVAYTINNDTPLDGTRLRFAINNLFDTDPPLADETYGYYSDLHSPRGRQFAIELRKKF